MMGDELTKDSELDALTRVRAERDRMRSELSESRRMLQMVMDNLPQCIYWKDRNGRLLGCNRLFADWMGFEEPDLLVGKSESDLIAENATIAPGFFSDREMEVMEFGIPQYHVIEACLLPTGALWLDSSHVPLFGKESIIGVMGSFQDITDRVRDDEELRKHRDHLSEMVRMRTVELETANQELAGANTALEEAAKAKIQFVASISHEIRTPMNAVMAMTELMLDTPVSSLQHEYLTTILDSSDSLLFTINDLLDFSKMEAGKLTLESLKFNLRETIEAALKSLAVKAFEKKLELLIEVDPRIPGFVRGDPLRVRQVLVNLVGNAIKFTSEGDIELKVRLRELTDSFIDIEFEVTDTGIGIPPERQKAIFSPFEQADQSTTRNFGGSGLGLSIVAQLVDLMHGGIHVSSEIGKGSRFTFNLVFEVTEETFIPRRRDPAGHFAGMRVVLFDDHPRFIHIFRPLLERWGFSVESAGSLEKMNILIQEGKPADLLIIDSEYAGGHGITDLAVRCTEVFGPNAKLLFTVSSGESLKAIEADKRLNGSELLFKPVVDFELAEKVMVLFGEEEMIERLKPHRRSLHGGPEQAFSILLVDDRPLNRKIGKALLEKFGHVVDFAENGEVAVRMVMTNRYDLVLMDIQMPVMDGYEASRQIRLWEQESGYRVPIIAVTANTFRGEEARIQDAGIDGYIAKPLRSVQLKNTIESVLKSVTQLPIPAQ